MELCPEDFFEWAVCNGFQDYELLDGGHFKKLERFGKYILIRPEPQALWEPVWDEKQWKKLAWVEFIPTGSHSGKWKKIKEMPDQWQISCSLPGISSTLCFHLALTSFKHVGIFPEQFFHWDYMTRFFHPLQEGLNGLNLFAYTGGATLAAAAAGLRMVHVDSVRQVVSWANRNRELSGLQQNVRWIVDDAMAFVCKEARRKKKYELIILDPPAYGHGTQGRKWKLEEHLNAMLQQVVQLLNPEHHLMILNVYSLGLSSVILHNLLQGHARLFGSRLKVGELCVRSRSGIMLPLGIWARMEKQPSLKVDG